MRIAKVFLKSGSPYSQSRYHDTPKLDKEQPHDWEMRTWRERLSVTDDGMVFIPPMAFKNSLDAVVPRIGMKIKGRRNQTYAKHFLSGVFVYDGPVLGIKKDDVPGEVLFVPSDGKKGGGSRVKRKFPVIHEWSAEVEFHIHDDIITKDVFEEHLEEAGKFIGIGRFRPEKGGYYGRYGIQKIEWSEVKRAA